MWHERKVGMFRTPYESIHMLKKKAPEQDVAVNPDVPLRFGFPVPLNACGHVPDCDIHETLVIFRYHLTKLLGYTCEVWKGEKQKDEPVVFRREYVWMKPASRALRIHECLVVRMEAGGLTTARHVLAFDPPYHSASIHPVKDADPPLFCVSFYYPDASKLSADVERSRLYLEAMLIACVEAREPKP